jgi:mannose-6-phosphate isomerase-like protein (cupin superfamily)
MMRRIRVISTENAEHYQWGNGCEGWHLARTEDLSVIQELVPAGCREARHYHKKAEQFFFVLSGTATLEVEGVICQLMPQQGLHIAAGKKHQLRNEGKEPLSFIVTSTPPSHGDRIDL